ncbi:MAG: peptidoglycan DD-metalloendopeptidase family protein [Methylococcaceae bacterium]|nr:peptidoglycan DD-metalloendopeptidase family protein [Methylococcaceae bacterium]
MFKTDVHVFLIVHCTIIVGIFSKNPLEFTLNLINRLNTILKNIYKPLFLGISLAMIAGSNTANAKHYLVKNLVKHSSHKQYAPKIIAEYITEIDVKEDKKYLAAFYKSEKSATRHALAKYQKRTPLDNDSLNLTPAKSALSSKHKNKADRSNAADESATLVDANPRPSSSLDAKNPNLKDQYLTTEINDGVTVYNDPLKSEAAQNSPLTAFKKHRTTLYKIKGGDTIASIFADLNLNNRLIRNRKISRQFKSLIPGKTLSINTNARGELTSLAYKGTSFSDLMESATTHEDGNTEAFSAETSTASALGQVKHVSTHAVIQSTLEQAGRNVSLPKKITKQLADIFAWDIDFSQNLRPNDQFTIVYERIFENGRAIDTGDIVAAEFINQGEKHQAVRYKDSDGHLSYYTPEGEGMRRAFLRNPVDYARVSSVFNPLRRHPVLNRIRAHKGVDYAASTGTPIKSTGDGRVAFKGRKGGYGQVVMIQHGNEYTTLYAHLSHFDDNLNEGAEVKQGQIIGYVGATGLATGPHLHYEFLVNGVHKDPLNIKLPHSLPINKALLSYFKTQTRPLLAQLDQARTTMLAKNIPQVDQQDVQQE